MIHRALHALPQHGSRKLAPLLYLTIIVSRAAADDGSVWTVGGAVRLMKNHGSVRMVSEMVRARVQNGGYIEFALQSGFHADFDVIEVNEYGYLEPFVHFRLSRSTE